MNKVVAFFLAVFAFFSGIFGEISVKINDIFNNYAFEINALKTGDTLGNVSSNLTVWSIEGNPFVNPQISDEYNIFDFVEYVELMQCTGGSPQRDLFVNPSDTSVADDYDFSKLINNCRGILSLGAKPYLKLGSVPVKYSKAASTDTMFGTNIYPPDDYDIYYNYIAACARALVEAFGKEELLKWRFAVMTEYENASWFSTEDGDPEKTFEAYCKLYDYTVQALIDEIGEDVFVGAHSMTVTEGLWDERDFIKHCAEGTNYKTGKKGSRLNMLTASFYDSKPGEYTSGMKPAQTIDHLRNAAEKYGFDNLVYGFDEGRILCGTPGKDSDELAARITGYTYQAAYDARLAKIMFENDISYFSAWQYMTDGMSTGIPTVSYYVAKFAALYKNAKTVLTEKVRRGLQFGTEVDAFSAFDEENGTLRVMAYNFKNDVNYAKTADLKFKVSAPQFGDKPLKVRAYVIDDNCNFFDEWVRDREKYGIDSSCSSWSPDDPILGSTATLTDERARNIYFNELHDKYEECAKLKPVEKAVKAENGEFTLDITLNPNAVVFYEITAA